MAGTYGEEGNMESSRSTINIQDFDQYDFINAPQYVDFNELAQNDDPNADVFFETHREEDDFLISVENLSPTIQLLTEQNNVMYEKEEQVNKITSKAGMDDVKVVYYSSPPLNKNTNNNTTRKTSSLNSTIGSFHTPIGEYSGISNSYDKENLEPSPPSEQFHDCTVLNNRNSYSFKNAGINTSSTVEDNKQFKSKSVSKSSPNAHDSLLSQLDKLHILSSDDEDTAVESIENSYQSPTKSPVKTDDTLIDTLLQTPGVKRVLASSRNAHHDSLLSELDELHILSSDDEGSVVEAIKNSYQSPTKSPVTTDASLIDTLAQPPGVKDVLDSSSKTHREEDNFLISVENLNPKIQLLNEQNNVIYEKEEQVNKVVSKVGRDKVVHYSSNKNLKSSALPITVPYKRAFSRDTRVPVKASHFVSLAEAVSNFQKHTPDRFRTLPRGRFPIRRSASCDVKSGKREASPSLTRSPKLLPAASAARSSSNEIKSNKRTATIPQPFNFSSSVRPRNSVAPTKEAISEFKFKARPAPKIKATVGIHDKPEVKVTLPVAPHFASDDRIRERNEKKIQQLTAQTPTAFSRPNTTNKSHLVSKTTRIPIRAPTPVEPPKKTTMKPFSFDQRDQAMLRRKEEKIKQEIEEEKKIQEFHANPLPSFDQRLPKRNPIPVTEIKPFNLKSDQRGVAYQRAFKQKLEEENLRQQHLTTFYANPPVVLHQPAFEPEHPPRVPLEPLDFHLYTKKRALERKEYDDHLKQLELEEEKQRREEQEKLEEWKIQEEMEKRRQLVHKAQPFKVPKPFEVKSSMKPLTVPQSPAFKPLPSQRRLTPNKN